jgi:hypothetical protein
MPRIRTHQRSWVGGEIAPSMLGHVEDRKVQTGATRMENFIPWPEGVAKRRPGFSFVREVKDSTKETRLLPFTYSVTETMVVEMGEGYFRFHTEGETLYWGTPRIISSIDLTANTITFTAPHGFASNDQIDLVVPTGSTAPTSISTTVTYYVISVNSTTIKISTSTGPGAEVDLITSAGSGVRAFFLNSELPPNYVASKNVSGIVTTLMTITGHGLDVVEPVEFTVSGGTIVSPLVANQRYYTRALNANTVTVHATEDDATNNVNPITMTAGTGTTRFHYGYEAGDLVNYPNAGVYHAKIDSPQDSAPGTSAWYAQPATAALLGMYEIYNPYVESNLFHVGYDQSGDVMALVHPDHPHYELRRRAAARWAFVAFDDYAPPIDPPAGLAGSPTNGATHNLSNTAASPTVFSTDGGANNPHGYLEGDTIYLTGGCGAVTTPAFYIINTKGPNTFTLKTVSGGDLVNSGSTGSTGVSRVVSLASENEQDYFVSAVLADGTESEVSAEVTVTNNLSAAGSYNTLTWAAVANAQTYRIYKSQTGLAGFIGETYEQTFKDDNIGPDLGFTPVIADDTLGQSGNYPGCIAHFEQRRVFSGVEALPQEVWFTKSGTESDLSYHLPVVDSDRIHLTLAALQSCAVKHLIPLANLVVLTNSTEFVITPVDSDVITPSKIRARAVSYTGASHVKPIVVNDRLLFCAFRGGHVYEFALKAAFEGYKPDDVSIRASHLFDGYLIFDSASQKAPVPVQWFVRSDGVLLGFTYVPGEEIGGWHQHTTDGDFESICCVAEGEEDRLYAVVQRNINGTNKRYIERMGAMAAVDIEDGCFLDSSLSYEGTAVTSVSGLSHLTGESAMALSGGAVQYARTVAAGVMSGLTSSTVHHVGLAYTSILQTCPAATGAEESMGQGRVKNPGHAWVRYVLSGEFEVGPELDDLVPAGTASELASAEEKVKLPRDWLEAGQIYIQQADPLPLNVVSLTVEHEVGT